MGSQEAKEYLERHGAVYGEHYTIHGLGDGIYGIEKMGAWWYSYEAQGHCRKTNYKKRGSEEEACQFLIEKAKEAALKTGHWKD